METLKLRKKLIKQFDTFISDDDKLMALEGVFDALDTNSTNSQIPDDHYNLINESREHYLSGSDQGVDWDDLKQRLISKYGL